jgi:hypothetical protein
MSQSPPLFVPDLSKPAGAAIDEHGNVACVTCRTRLPLARMDMVGQGYRCTPCSNKAQITSLVTGQEDISANLSSGDRTSMRKSAIGLMGLGAAGIVGGIVVVAAFGIGRWIIAGGFGSIVVGAHRYSVAGRGGF